MSAVMVCALADIASGQVRKFAIDGRNIAVVRIDDAVYAIGDKCSHADVSLSDGEVLCDTKELECSSTAARLVWSAVCPTRFPLHKRCLFMQRLLSMATS